MKDSSNYVDPDELKAELIKFKNSYNDEVDKLVKKGVKLSIAKKEANGKISEELGTMFMQIANNLSNKGNFNRYTYKEDMIGRGIMFLCMYAKNYDENIKNCNAFAYISQICFNGFIQYIKKEGRYSQVKDDIMKTEMSKTQLERWEQDKDRI